MTVPLRKMMNRFSCFTYLLIWKTSGNNNDQEEKQLKAWKSCNAFKQKIKSMKDIFLETLLNEEARMKQIKLKKKEK